MKRILILLFFVPLCVIAQDDLLKELESNEQETTTVASTFKGTRICNGHSIKTTPGRSLEFIFSHRFGRINEGAYEMFGLDQAYVRLGFDYGITDRLSVSIGRNSYDKTLDGYVKYQLLQQSTGKKNVPVSITALGGMAYKLSPKSNADAGTDFTNSDRLSYTTQALIARKFSSAISLQLMPSWVHKNRVDQDIEDNDQLALGLGGRVKVTKSMAITGEYYHNFSMQSDSPYYNPISIGLDIETGGHVFQLIFTNAIGLTERGFITETTDNFFDGDIHFGFNVTRTFQF